jgi:hypothetical protein
MRVELNVLESGTEPRVAVYGVPASLRITGESRRLVRGPGAARFLGSFRVDHPGVDRFDQHKRVCSVPNDQPGGILPGCVTREQSPEMSISAAHPSIKLPYEGVAPDLRE